MTRRILVLVVVLAGVLVCREWLSGSVVVPPRQSLDMFPSQLGTWSEVRDGRLSPGIAEVLKADDYVSRTYRSLSGVEASLFVAYFRMQRAGETMHSPKNCLAGGGWQPVVNDRIAADLGTGKPETINRYLLERAGSRMLVLYWYQAHGRIIADEYRGKFFLVWDAIRQHRRDGAIVRITVPMDAYANERRATEIGLELAQSAAQSLPEFLPN